MGHMISSLFIEFSSGMKLTVCYIKRTLNSRRGDPVETYKTASQPPCANHIASNLLDFPSPGAHLVQCQYAVCGTHVPFLEPYGIQ